MPGGAGRCWAAVQWWRRSGPPCRCRHRGAVLGGRASAGAVTWARSGRPAGGRRREDVRDAGQAGRCPVRLLWSAVGMSVQPVERTSNVQGVRCPVSRRPGIQVSGRTSSGVRGAAATLSAPRRTLEWLGVAGRPGWPNRSTCPVVGGRRGRLPPQAGREGDGAALAVAGSHEVDRSQGRRLAGVPAAAPPWPQRAGTGAGPGQGAGRGRGAWGAWEGAGAHQPRQGVLGALVGVVPTTAWPSSW